MSILEEEKLNRLTEKLTELDFRDSNVAEKVTEIINDVLKDNADKIGTLTNVKTVNEVYSEEQKGFDELVELDDAKVLEHIENVEIREKLKIIAKEGIKDEEAEKLSLEEAGFPRDAIINVRPEDIIKEVIKILEEVIRERKEAIDKKIEENEAMRPKIEKREEIKAAREKLNNLYQKTQNYKGTEGKNLNKNVGAAVTDLDIQLAKLTRETSRNGVEITDSVLDEENKKFEEEKKGLDDLLSKIRESYEKQDTEKLRFTIIEKQIDDITAGITADMKFEDFQSKAKELYKLYEQNGKSDEVVELFRNKMITIKKEDDRGIEKEVQFDVAQIANAGSGAMNMLRGRYISYTSTKPRTDEDKEILEENIEMTETEYKRNKEVLETICGNEVYVEPLMTEQDYVNKISKMAQNAEKQGMMGSGKANKAAQEMQKLYRDLERILECVLPDCRGAIETEYEIAAKALYDNTNVKEENLPPKTLRNLIHREGKENPKAKKKDKEQNSDNPNNDKDNKNPKLDLIEKQIDNITSEITANMTLEDFQSKAMDLYKIYERNGKSDEVVELFKNKMITIKKEDGRGIEKEVQLNVGQITDTGTGRMNVLRAQYINYTSQEPETEEEKREIEEKINTIKIKYKNYKKVFETICGNDVNVEPLMTEQDYIEKFNEMEPHAGKQGFMASNRANVIAQQMKDVCKRLKGFIEHVKTKDRIDNAYRIVAEKLYDNKAVKDWNLPPRTLLDERTRRTTAMEKYKEDNSDNRIDGQVYRKMQETQEQIAKDVGKFSRDVIDKDGNVIKNGQGETSQYNYGYDSNDGNR